MRAFKVTSEEGAGAAGCFGARRDCCCCCLVGETGAGDTAVTWGRPASSKAFLRRVVLQRKGSI